MNERRRVTAALALATLWAGAATAAPDARELMARSEAATQNANLVTTAVLTTGGGGMPQRTKQFTWWRKLQSDNVRFFTLTRFQAPAEVRGEAILFLEQASGTNDVQLYLPAYKKVRRIESQQQKGSFMGSELSYSDITTSHLDDYTFKLQGTQPCPPDAGTKLLCFVIEAIPASASVRERTGYGKIVNWVRQDNYVAVRLEYRGEDGALLKRAEGSDVREVDPAKHKWLVHRVRVEAVNTGRFTSLELSKVKVDENIPDATFTVQNLSRE